MIKTIVKAILPKGALSEYHLLLAKGFAWAYGTPSEKMVVIGVTGTNGKSSVVSFISQLLGSLGKQTGYSTTVAFKVGATTWLNDKKMTMLGRGYIQKLLSDMVKAETDYAIIETSSEGIAQSRHRGINYDVAVFTNLTPEHIESHGSFENYKKAKQSLFTYTAASPRKELSGTMVKKLSILNADDAHAVDFVTKGFDETVTFSTSGTRLSHTTDSLSVTIDATTLTNSAFTVNGVQFTTPLFGRFTLENVIAALTTVHRLGFSLEELVPAVENLKPVPGRLEFIEAGQPFKVLIDYAPEPASLEALYEALSLVEYGRLIHVLGSAGGGRDTSRRPILGSMAGKRADVVMVTNEDPYDEDPETIIEDVAQGARSVGKQDNHDLFMILNRKEAIARAFSQARPGDLVVITGKGSEQAMVVKHGKKVPWDDRVVSRELLAKLVDKV